MTSSPDLKDTPSVIIIIIIITDMYSAFRSEDTEELDIQYFRKGTRYGHSFNGILLGT